MSERTAGSDVGAATMAAIASSAGTRPRRWLIALTLLLGLLAAVAVTAGSPTDRTFVAVSGAVQSLMSIALPFIGVLLVGDLRRAPRAGRLRPTLLAAVLVAAAVGAFGVLVSAVAVAVAPPGPAADPWGQFATIAVGSVLVQVVAQLVGTGLGLLLRPPFVAFLASIVLPLGLWFVLGIVDVLSPARRGSPRSRTSSACSPARCVASRGCNGSSWSCSGAWGSTPSVRGG